MLSRFGILIVLALGLSFGTGLAEAKEYGPWFPAPGTAGAGAYQAKLDPFSSSKVAELTNFTCVYRVVGSQNNQPVSDSEHKLLGIDFKAAAQIYSSTYQGDNKLVKWFSDGEPSSGDSARKVSRQTAMYDFLVTAKLLLKQYGRSAESVPDADADKIIQSIQGGNKNSLPAQDQFSEKMDPSSANPTAAAGIWTRDLNGQIQSPIQLTRNLSEGCAFNPLAPNPVKFGQIFGNPGQFFLDLILWVLEKPVEWSYNFIQPKAFLYTFWTPHVERGDTFMNVPSTCVTETTPGKYATTKYSDGCANGQPLGFSRARANPRKQAAWYLDISYFIQWLLSGAYFLLLFSAAVVFMFRGSKSANFNVLQMVPRILLSVLLTIFAPWMIGALISLSNVFVVALFSFNSLQDVRSVGAINDILQSSPYIIGSGGNGLLSDGAEIGGRIAQLVVGALTTFFFFSFVIVAVARQIILIILMILAPAAAFCLLVPSWRPRFGFFLRMVFACIFLPAALAFMLKIGMTINPLVSDPTDIQGEKGLLGLFVMLLTLWAMARAAKMARAYATGSAGSLMAGAMAKLGGIAGQAGMAGIGGKWGSLALRGAGAGLNQGSALSTALDQASAKIVPTHRGMMGGQAPQIGRAFKQARAALPAGGGGMGMGGRGGMGGGILDRKIQERMMRRQASHGERNISPFMAQQRMLQESQALSKFLDERRAELGGDNEDFKLSMRDIHRAKDEFYNGRFALDEQGRVMIDEHGDAVRTGAGWKDVHGEVVRRGGRYIEKRPEEQYQGASMIGAAARGVAGAPIRVARWTGHQAADHIPGVSRLPEAARVLRDNLPGAAAAGAVQAGVERVGDVSRTIHYGRGKWIREDEAVFDNQEGPKCGQCGIQLASGQPDGTLCSVCATGSSMACENCGAPTRADGFCTACGTVNDPSTSFDPLSFY